MSEEADPFLSRAIASLLPAFQDHTRIKIALTWNETNAISPPRSFLGLSPKKGRGGGKHKQSVG